MNPNSVTAHITAATVNSHSRHHYPGADQHLIFQRNRDLLVRYDALRDGKWGPDGEPIPDTPVHQPAEHLPDDLDESDEAQRTSPRKPRPTPPTRIEPVRPDARGQVGRALELLGDGLAPFVGERMLAVRGANWYDIFRGRDNSSLERALMDPRFLLKVMTAEWDAFSPPLKKRERNLIFELRDTGNLWAHYEPFNWDDVDRALDSVERLLTPVDAEKAATVRQAKVELRRRRDAEES